MQDWDEPRELDEAPEAPRHKKKAPKKKLFGIEYFSDWLGDWHNRTWYATSKARDQAYDDLIAKTNDTPRRHISEIRKVDR